MTLGTVSTARRARLSPPCRMVRPCVVIRPGLKTSHRIIICWFSVELYKNTFVDCANTPLQQCFSFGFSQWILYVNSVCVYSQAVPCQTVWIMYHSPQLCWFANSKIHLYFLSFAISSSTRQSPNHSLRYTSHHHVCPRPLAGKHVKSQLSLLCVFVK